MKHLATIVLASLLIAPAANAARIDAPAASQSPTVAVLVDLEDQSAALYLGVVGVGNASVPDASGRGGIELPGVPDGIHAWRLTIRYADGTEEHHEGAVSVLDVATLVQRAVQGAAQAGSTAAANAQEAVQAAQAAQAAADAARAAVERLPQDVARQGDVAALVTGAEFAAFIDAQAAQQEAEAEQRSTEAVQATARLDALDDSVSALLLVVALGVALVAWYVAQVRRASLTDQDRALLQALAVRLEITEDSPEYAQALHDLDVERRSQGGLRERVQRLLPGRVSDGGRA